MSAVDFAVERITYANDLGDRSGFLMNLHNA